MAGALRCPECARSFFLPRAGRSMDDERLQLEPVPLLREDGGVKVALTHERTGADSLDDAVAARRRAEVVSRGCAAWRGGPALASRRRAPAPAHRAPTRRATCAASAIPEDHRHLLHLSERRIVCACEACWALRSGEADYRPTGNRTLWLPELDVPDDLWASFQIPIGLAFFMESTVTGVRRRDLPEPGGATESRARTSRRGRGCGRSTRCSTTSSPTSRALIVNRLADPPMYAIAPIDQCYALTGTIKARWEGISGRRRRRGGGGASSSTRARARGSATRRR